MVFAQGRLHMQGLSRQCLDGPRDEAVDGLMDGDEGETAVGVGRLGGVRTGERVECGLIGLIGWFTWVTGRWKMGC